MQHKVKAVLGLAKMLPGDYRLHVTRLEKREDGTVQADIISFSDGNVSYTVAMKRVDDVTIDATCTCEAMGYGNLCQHVAAAFRQLFEDAHPRKHAAQESAPEAPEQTDNPTPPEQTPAPTPDPLPEPPEIEPEGIEDRVAVVPAPIEPQRVERFAPVPMPEVAVAEIVRRNALIDQLVHAMKENTDFGKVQGIDRPFLFQPGAEKAALFFNAVAEYEIIEQEVDHARQTPYRFTGRTSLGESKPADYQQGKAEGRYSCRPIEENGKKKFLYYSLSPEEGTSDSFYRFMIRCTLRHRSTGAVFGSAVAVCSSLEDKYIKKPRNAENTIVQMAQKRAFVRAIRTALALSDRFTQDEDLVAPGGE